MEDADMQRLEEQLRGIKSERRAWLIGAGKVFRFVSIIALGLVIAFQIPSIGSTPFAQLTPNDLIWTVAGIGLALGCVKWAFAGTTDEAAESWGRLAIILIAVIIGLSFYVTR